MFIRCIYVNLRQGTRTGHLFMLNYFRHFSNCLVCILYDIRVHAGVKRLDHFSKLRDSRVRRNRKCDQRLSYRVAGCWNIALAPFFSILSRQQLRGCTDGRHTASRHDTTCLANGASDRNDAVNEYFRAVVWQNRKMDSRYRRGNGLARRWMGGCCVSTLYPTAQSTCPRGAVYVNLIAVIPMVF